MLRVLPKRLTAPARHASTLAEARRRWNNRLVVAPEVEHALETGAAVVALESAIITHGMPYPTNLHTAQTLEAIMRSYGVVPATVALLDRRVHIGLREAELAALADPATVRAQPAVKVSRRDLAPALAGRRAGGTTVAGTMVAAQSVGIQSFVTGGIGGVHRGAQNSMDVSADLVELGRTPMMVVCAGAKSILDIPLTLEVLETHGVCVTAFGPKDDFPAFYSPSSGCKAPWRAGSVMEAAEIVYTGLTLPSPQATLLAVPIPDEYAARGAQVQAAVEQAVRESVEQGIDRWGKEVTPWLLARVGELTKGTALELNVKLIENNAHIGSQVALEVARMARDASSSACVGAMSAIPAVKSGISPVSPSYSAAAAPVLPAPRVLVFGAAAVDLTSSSAVHNAGTTTPGTVSITAGGVGRNIAEAAQNLLPAHAVQLVSPVGTAEGQLDPLGFLLTHALETSGLRTDGLQKLDGATPACSLLLGGGDLVGGVADMGLVETMTPEAVSAHIETTKPRLVAFDLNLSPGTITSLLETTSRLSIPALCDPTSVPKLRRLVPALLAHPRAVDVAANAAELDALHAALEDEDGWSYINALGLGAEWRASVDVFCNKAPAGGWIRSSGAVTKMVGLLPWVRSWWVKAGELGLVRLSLQQDKPETKEGITVFQPTAAGGYIVLSYYPPPVITPAEIVSSTGAGDTLAGGIIAGLVGDEPERVWVAKAVERVGRTLRSTKAVA